MGNLAGQHRDAQIDVTEDALARIVLRLVGRRAEQRFGHRLELLDCGDAELFLAFEVMKEAALGETGRLANIVDGGGGIALGANDIGGGGQKLAAGLLATPWQRLERLFLAVWSNRRVWFEGADACLSSATHAGN